MNAEILAVGTEILLGDIVNTNAQYLADQFARMGINVMHQSVVGDNAERLSASIRESLTRSDFLITTGGLGPTGDDITRETIASVLGLKLVLDEPSMEKIQDYFNKTGRIMGESNRKQAYLPEGSIILRNDFGTAPGCIVEDNGKIIAMLPGPPREMKPMFEHFVKPYLAKFSSSVIASINLRVYGIPESNIQDMLSDLMDGANPSLAPYAKDGEVLLRVTARADSTEAALQLCRPVAEEVKKRLGDCVYGENVNSLQQVVVEKLKNLQKKIAVAESCTGGYLAKRLTEIPGCSEVFDCGIVSYANCIKHKLLGVRNETLESFGAVSPQTAAEMAEGIRLTANADFGVGITGIAGPDGGTEEKPVGLVYIALSDGGTCLTRKLLLGHGSRERDYIRYLATSNVLDMVRRYISGLDQVSDVESNEVPQLRTV